MKALVTVITSFTEARTNRSNFRTLFRLLAVLVTMIFTYSVIFHVLMGHEGRDYSWITGVYWTLTVMSTLGFGDITFNGDLGKSFSILVMISGVVSLLVIMPFTFIKFFYAPWMRAQAEARAPRQLPQGTTGHVILTAHDAVTAALIPMLVRHGHPYVLLLPSVTDALQHYEDGFSVAVGDLDDPVTYHFMRLREAAALVASRTEVINTNITFTARELAENIPIIATATSDRARDVLELAGATLVLRLEEQMANALARRVIGRDGIARHIGDVAGLPIAEASVCGTILEGKTIAETSIRSRTGLNIIGIWRQGKLRTPAPEDVLEKSDLLLLSGTQKQIETYNEAFEIDGPVSDLTLIIGGGAVGGALYKILSKAGLRCVLIEQDAKRGAEIPGAIIGNAMDIDTLKSAGAREASTVILTTHDDDLNISLSIFFRRLRSEFRIISRCTSGKNVRTLHRAGANLVLSSAAMGANEIYNTIFGEEHFILAEGVVIFHREVPPSLFGRTIADSRIREETGCTVIALERQGDRMVNPDPHATLGKGDGLLLVGTLKAEGKFLEQYGAHPRGLGRLLAWIRHRNEPPEEA